jgi:glucosamine 6-phosphate synthetase-like amidotransferase/phosphosugar isomerase protein
MKHGPNALIDEKPPVVILAAHDPSTEESQLLYEKTLSNIQEVKAREGMPLQLLAYISPCAAAATSISRGIWPKASPWNKTRRD